jgi:hypothetical protein
MFLSMISMFFKKVKENKEKIKNCPLASSTEPDMALLSRRIIVSCLGSQKSLVVGQVVSSSTDPDNSTSSDSTGVSFFYC